MYKCAMIMSTLQPWSAKSSIEEFITVCLILKMYANFPFFESNLVFDGFLLQTDLQTHVSARDVVSHFQKHVNPDCWPVADTSPTAGHKSKTNPTFNAPATQGDWTRGKETEGGAKTMQLHYHNQVG